MDPPLISSSALLPGPLQGASQGGGKSLKSRQFGSRQGWLGGSAGHLGPVDEGI